MLLLLAGFFHLRVPESSAVGSAVGRIKAHDLDIGKNAEVEYTIVPGDGGAMFDITTNEHNQEGIIILRKVASQKCKRFHVLLMTLTHAFAGSIELPEMGKDRTVSVSMGQVVAVT